MKFCTKCNNMYYLSISEGEEEGSTSQLVYYCRNCGHQDNTTDITGTMSVSTSNMVEETTNMTHIINKYTKLDPTLPRINTIPCPNVECPTNTNEKEREVIYIRYDENNIRYAYLCSTCDFVWKTNDQ